MTPKATLLAIVAAFLPTMVAAQTIEAFRLSSQPEFQNGAGATVYVIDAMNLMTQQLSVGLPANAAEAARIASQRLKSLSAQEKQVLRTASTARIRAAEYQIIKAPAIVFDGKAIVYGVHDINQAAAIYRGWRAQRGG